MGEIAIRFIIGGLFVTAFALIGDVLKPKSFAGLFGAAPSVALATLALTVISEGAGVAATESVSMMVAAIALFCYASCMSWIMMHRPHRTIWTTIAVLPVWAGVAFGLWYVLLK